MNRTAVQDSKKVASWGYDPAAACLEIEYVWGSVVRYFDVTPELAAEFEQAASKGSFLSKRLERNAAHQWQKLTPAEAIERPVAPEFQEPAPDPVKDAEIFEADRDADRAGDDARPGRRRRVRLL